MPITLALVGFVAYASRAGPEGGRGRGRRRARVTRIVVAALAATTALWLGGKVFSPQYLTWALPLAIALPGRAWIRVSFVLGLVVLVSQIYLRGLLRSRLQPVARGRDHDGRPARLAGRLFAHAPRAAAPVVEPPFEPANHDRSPRLPQLRLRRSRAPLHVVERLPDPALRELPARVHRRPRGASARDALSALRAIRHRRAQERAVRSVGLLETARDASSSE